MSRGRFARRLEAPDQEQQRNGRQRQPRYDAETIHKGQQTDLPLKLPVEKSMRSDTGIRA